MNLFFFNSLAELLSEQVKHNASQVTDTTNTRLGIGRLNSTLSELFDLAGAAHATALVVLDEESQTLGAMIADIEVVAICLHAYELNIKLFYFPKVLFNEINHWYDVLSVCT